MPKISVIIVVGDISDAPDKSCVVCNIKNGLASIPHFESLKLNEVLNSVSGPEPVGDWGAKFTSPEACIILLQDAKAENILQELSNAINGLPHLVALVYSGLICQSTGYWILPEAVFKPDYLVEKIYQISGQLHQPLADTTKETMPPINLHIACSSVPLGGEWRQMLSSHLPSTLAGRPLHVTVNRTHVPPKKAPLGAPGKLEFSSLPSDLSGVEAFTERLEVVLRAPVAPTLCKPVTKTNGCSIRIQRPCLYVFPEGSGQSAIFALPGFALMVNSGCSRNPKAWMMAQYLEKCAFRLLDMAKGCG